MSVVGAMLTAMTHTTVLSKVLVSLFLVVIFSPRLLAQKTTNFSGDWAVKLGGRVFIVVRLEVIPGGTTQYRTNGGLSPALGHLRGRCSPRFYDTLMDSW